MEPPSRTSRTSHGCWTCRLRRKKCDEQRPVCDTCAALCITCHYGDKKPEWMDGGTRQEKMIEQLKREVKQNAPYRRFERPHVSGDKVFNTGSGERLAGPQNMMPEPKQNGRDRSKESHVSPSQGTSCFHLDRSSVVGRSDSILTTFYLQSVLPFLFPFYRPPIARGGTAWILELMIRSPVVRQATLCQGCFFFCLAQGTDSRQVICDTVFSQVREAFQSLEIAIQAMGGSDIIQNPQGAVQIMASIVQMLHFEVAALTFENCGAHLNAALALFGQLFDRSAIVEPVGLRAHFNAFMDRLGPSSYIPPAEHILIPSAEQDAFYFTTALLLFDDVIASTTLQKRPRLYQYHQSLLKSTEGCEPIINLEEVIGCQNTTMLQIGEIAVLDEWKRECQNAVNLDIIELASRATPIKNALEGQIMSLESEPSKGCNPSGNLLDFLAPNDGVSSSRRLVTLVWTRAALLYLLVVVSGWQPASDEVRYHVGQIIDLLANKLPPSTLPRSMVWPFCIAGCLAEPAQRDEIRRMVEALQPSIVFSTARKALQVMENVWHRKEEDAYQDFSACFKAHGDMVLLV
ncbi:unnamed protein product [Clonostachys chloroleuca]|uniref:Zn(2)-C6 fungal-type domain-containing protein n=1 Tax=Clonostachys chloroleuca TaxID=1926264 RepID=A0AA35LT20_9HYPO|nr:unnamed protein product [Clonostachys chloroleuca]